MLSGVQTEESANFIDTPRPRLDLHLNGRDFCMQILVPQGFPKKFRPIPRAPLSKTCGHASVGGQKAKSSQEESALNNIANLSILPNKFVPITDPLI